MITGWYDGLMQLGMLDWISGRGVRLVLQTVVISINNGVILVKTRRYDGLMQIGMLDWFSDRGDRMVLVIGMLCW